MKVTIFVATGFACTAILKEAIAQNHQVTILVRNKSAISIHDQRLTIVEGNVMDRKKVSEALKIRKQQFNVLARVGKASFRQIRLSLIRQK